MLHLQSTINCIEGESYVLYFVKNVLIGLQTQISVFSVVLVWLAMDTYVELTQISIASLMKNCSALTETVLR